ncbi:hypothetical protein CY34DRAFT_738984 [Suillus luteus UH-Slu-Lm8-n1]|uniref:Unplaced genomic scaffold CY34scaffold_917, whole genome shotgun sequence n=1 Tax=Suillus luteus UH-Slu-Lm8-n1 TaxID=930992 RepID=A0A0D0AFP9_9AGAM|nr:hypothetical protein CY34DRAFT_738984 [Suillus luteus UH-Slu-Lm8-n1]
MPRLLGITTLESRTFANHRLGSTFLDFLLYVLGLSDYNSLRILGCATIVCPHIPSSLFIDNDSCSAIYCLLFFDSCSSSLVLCQCIP